MMTIVAITGSLDQESYTMKLVRAVKFQAPEFVEFKILDMNRLLYSTTSFDASLSSELTAFYHEIETADAFIIATAEYKRSYSPVLKYVLELGLASCSDNKWAGKPVSIIGCTPYNLNAFGGIGQLKLMLEQLHMEVFFNSDFYFSNAQGKFDGSGMLTDLITRNVITGFWDAFVTWIDNRE